MANLIIGNGEDLRALVDSLFTLRDPEKEAALSEEEREHSDTLTAVLCREGIAPYAEAVVGGRRLRAAVRLSAALACLGSVVGVLLAFYLTFVQAYASLTPVNLLIYLLMWLVPTPLISGWVDRY